MLILEWKSRMEVSRLNVADLLNRIESLRRSMIEVAIDKGFSSSESIEISRELDSLLNQYEKVKSLDN